MKEIKISVRVINPSVEVVNPQDTELVCINDISIYLEKVDNYYMFHIGEPDIPNDNVATIPINDEVNNNSPIFIRGEKGELTSVYIDAVSIILEKLLTLEKNSNMGLMVSSKFLNKEDKDLEQKTNRIINEYYSILIEIDDKDSSFTKEQQENFFSSLKNDFPILANKEISSSEKENIITIIFESKKSSE